MYSAPGSTCTPLNPFYSQCLPDGVSTTTAPPSTTTTSTTTTTTSIPPGQPTHYSISDTYIGRNWLSGFEHQAIADPTHGRVKFVVCFLPHQSNPLTPLPACSYVDESTALSQNLTYTSDDTIIMRADYTTVLDPSGPGRNSVRIQSKKAYTNAVSIINVRHMPEGCAYVVFEILDVCVLLTLGLCL